MIYNVDDDMIRDFTETLQDALKSIDSGNTYMAKVNIIDIIKALNEIKE